MDKLYRNNLKESILFLLLGLISPILALPFVLLSIYKKNLASIYVLAFIVALLIGLMPPYADNYHYYVIYERTCSFDIQYWLTKDKDFLFTLLSYIFNSLHFSYIQFRLFLVISEMLIFSWIFYDFTKTHISYLDNRKCLWLVLICFFTLDIVFIGFAIRYALMATFLILSIYVFYKGSRFKSLIFLLLALGSHYSGFLFVPCILLACIFKYNFSRLQRLTWVVICLFFGSIIFLWLYPMLPSVLQADTYVTGTWSDFSYKSFNGMMFYVLQYYVVAGILVVWYLCSKTKNNYLTRVAFFMLLLFAGISSFSELLQRVWWVAKIFVVFSLLETILLSVKKRTSLLKIYLLAFLLLFSQAMSFYGFRKAIFDPVNIKHSVFLPSFISDESYNDAYFFMKNRI